MAIVVQVHKNVFHLYIPMHNPTPMTVIHCTSYLGEDRYFVLLGQLFVMIVEVVEEGHLHKVGYEANISVVREIIAELNDVRMVDRLKNGHLSLRTINLIPIH